MSIEALNLFEVVESVLTSSLGRLAPFRELPRTRLARELLETFDLLGEMRKRSGRVAELIQRCEACQTPEGKVYFIFETGKALKLLGETCGQFLYWNYSGTYSDKRTVRLSRLLSPELQETVRKIIDEESLDPDETKFPVPHAVEELREALEAIPHPDPRKLPSPEVLRQAGERFESLASSCDEARAGLRTFAGTALVVEDFF
jgi:hypothetical protein